MVIAIIATLAGVCLLPWEGPEAGDRCNAMNQLQSRLGLPPMMYAGWPNAFPNGETDHWPPTHISSDTLTRILARPNDCRRFTAPWRPHERSRRCAGSYIFQRVQRLLKVRFGYSSAGQVSGKLMPESALLETQFTIVGEKRPTLIISTWTLLEGK